MSNYIENNLLRDETVIYKTTYHSIIYWRLTGILSLFIIPILEMKNDEFAITNKRVIIKTGWISRSIFEINHSKIESVNVDQSILGRIFNYGSINIIGSGGTKGIFHTIKNPFVFRSKIQEFSN